MKRAITLKQIAKEIFESLGKISWESFVVNKNTSVKTPRGHSEALRTGKMEFTKLKLCSIER
jgi:hypothetical protein